MQINFTHKDTQYTLFDHIGIIDEGVFQSSLEARLIESKESILTDVKINGSLSYYSMLDPEAEAQAIKRPFWTINDDLKSMSADECINAFESDLKQSFEVIKTIEKKQLTLF